MDVRITVSSEQGLREYQEDRVICKVNLLDRYILAAVFDGHVGYQASEYMMNNVVSVMTKELNTDKVIQRKLFDAIKTLEFGYSGNGYKNTSSDKYQKHLKTLATTAGTTAVLCILDTKNSMLYIANVGDSRAILVRDRLVYQITNDHSMDNIGDENLARFQRDGCAEVKDGYLWTSAGENAGKFGLNVTRTLGDPIFKSRFNPCVLNAKKTYDIIGWHPDLYSYRIHNGDIIVLGSDGIYNFLTNVETARAAIKGGAKEVTRQALKNHSSDNVSAIVININ